MKEKKTGVTWHFVTKDIDKGAIISQKEIALSKIQPLCLLHAKAWNLHF